MRDVLARRARPRDPVNRKLRSVKDASEAGEEYVAVASTRGLSVANPPRWKPAVLHNTIVPFGAVNVRTASSESSRAPRRADSSRRAGARAMHRHGAAGGASRHVFERPVPCIHVDEVEEHLQEVLVVEVAVPALRRDPVGIRGLRHRVPHVDVLELRPEAEVRVRDVEQAM